MLVLTRRLGESIIIANNIKLTVVSVGPGRVKIGIEAPPHVRVDRQEIHDKIEQSSDVLAAVGVGATATEAQNTAVVNGPETAPVAGGTPESATAARGTNPPPLGLASKYRFPRKPR